MDNLRLELRRGCLTIAVLSQLSEERYGYALSKSLFESGLSIEENTLYPLLRRLEAQGLLTSRWRDTDSRSKRYYRLSAAGKLVLDRLLAEWQTINSSLERMVASLI